jgi:hypothetical protein
VIEVDQTAVVDLVACALVSKKNRERIRLVNAVQRMRKGYFRWLFVVQNTGGWGDFYDAKKFIQCSTSATAIIAGPWDGSTTPRQQNI